MSTNSMIGIVNSDGSVEAIYCHYDGSVSHQLPILNENYITEEIVRELISMGSLSSLGESIHPTKEHTWMSPQDDVCIFYSRDRKESMETNKPRKYHSVNTFWSTQKGIEFLYLFDPETEEWEYKRN